ncbi:MAG: rod-binding protein [Lachnospiraceae bacterium]
MSIGLNTISSYLDQTDKLSANQNTDLSKANEDELMDVCKEFEAYFIEQVMKEMEKTIPKSEDESTTMSGMTDYFKEFTMQNMAAEISEQQDLGLAQSLFEQMKRNYSTLVTDTDSVTE